MDLLIRGGQVFNVYQKKFLSADIVVNGGIIAFVGDAASLDFDYRKTVAAAGKFIVPGLLDIHMHIESSMATPLAFAAEVIKRGVTTIVSEPHEIANVFGIAGVREMIKAGAGAAVDIFYGVPSSVPSTAPEFETTGAAIGLSELAELMREDRVICLGEVMNCYDLIHGRDTKTHQFLEFCRSEYGHLPIEGHCNRVSGFGLAKVLAAGVTSDHTQQTEATLAEKLAAGMFIELQEKSLNQANIAYIVTNELYEQVALVTDDVMADKLVHHGHLDRLIQQAVTLGMPAEQAIYCATYTPARRMNLHDRGSIAPGKIADLVFLNDPEQFTIHAVYKRGTAVSSPGSTAKTAELSYRFPEHFYHSVQRAPVTEDELLLSCDRPDGSVRCRIIKVQNGTTATEEMVAEITVRDGRLDWESTPYCLIAVLERYGKNNNIGLGLVTGATIKRGAVAASYAHDHHNILAVGKSLTDIIPAINTVIERQGGYFVVEDGRLKAGIELPIGGILSAKDLPSIGRELAAVTAAMRELGYEHYNPVMSFSTQGLPVSPLLKITDRGLIRYDRKQLVDILAEEI